MTTPTETKRRLRDILLNNILLDDTISSIESLYAEREVKLVKALQGLLNITECLPDCKMTYDGINHIDRCARKPAFEAIKSISEGEKP